MLQSALQKNGGWFVGHTEFRNGQHGNGWIEKGSIIQYPALLDTVLQEQSKAIAQHFPEVEMLIGSSECGAVVASFVARHLNLPLALTSTTSERVAFHRMNIPQRGTKVVLVDDLIFSGQEMRAHITFFRETGIVLLGASVWINRQPPIVEGISVISLLPPPFLTYEAAECPLCQNDVPLKYRHIRE